MIQKSYSATEAMNVVLFMNHQSLLLEKVTSRNSSSWRLALKSVKLPAKNSDGIHFQK